MDNRFITIVESLIFGRCGNSQLSVLFSTAASCEAARKAYLGRRLHGTRCCWLRHYPNGDDHHLQIE